MSYTSSTGDRKGAQPRDKTPSRKRSQPDPAVRAVHDRAFAFIREVWAAERWKSSVTTKVPPYLATLLSGRKLDAVPSGVPHGVVQLVRRSIARACLELGVTGLPVQSADWYAEAETAARAEMPPS